MTVHDMVFANACTAVDVVHCEKCSDDLTFLKFITVNIQVFVMWCIYSVLFLYHLYCYMICCYRSVLLFNACAMVL